MAVLVLLPVVVGSTAVMINLMDGSIEAAFIDILSWNFDYRFGPEECAWGCN